MGERVFDDGGNGLNTNRWCCTQDTSRMFLPRLIFRNVSNSTLLWGSCRGCRSLHGVLHEPWWWPDEVLCAMKVKKRNHGRGSNWVCGLGIKKVRARIWSETILRWYLLQYSDWGIFFLRYWIFKHFFHSNADIVYSTELHPIYIFFYNIQTNADFIYIT